MTKQNDSERVVRAATVTYPVASFTVRQSHIAWIARAAKAAGLSKSEFVRRVFDRAMEEREAA